MESKVKKRLIWLLAGLFTLTAMISAAACIPTEEKPAFSYQIYNVNNEETGIVTREYQTNTWEQTAVVEELLVRLETVPDKLDYKSPLAGSFKLLDYEIADGQIILRFDEHYKEQSLIAETLVRAALVKTLTQVQGLQYVSIMVNSEPLVDSMGHIVGVMSADMFIDNAGTEFSNYEKAKLRLYFANESGDGLVVVTRNNVVYNSNVAIEKVIVESLINGPAAEENGYAILNPDTRIISITVKDGTCYVNLDHSFLDPLQNVNAATAIYALTNSLVELPNVNRVQFSVNGETNLSYKEEINLSLVFERNLDIVTHSN